VSAWVARDGDQATGFVLARKLQWDSEQIGMPAARIDYLFARGGGSSKDQIIAGLVDQVLKQLDLAGVQHLSARLDASDLVSLRILEQAGFILVDGLLTFALGVSDEAGTIAAPQIPCRLRLATPGDAVAAADLARRSYTYDRFHSDPAIPRQRADELHATWLVESCAGRAADAVILAENAAGLLGFVTCKLHPDTRHFLGKLVGSIVLVATTDTARRQGIARLTTQAALNWFREQGVRIVEVGTQLRNIPASRLYESCGFRLVSASLSLRKLLS